MFVKSSEIFVRLLRWSEKYTKTDMVYLASGGSWLIMWQGVSAIAGLLITIAFANLLDPNVFGTYKFVLSVVGILTVTTLPSMSTALVRAIAQGNETAFMPVFQTRVYWGLIGAIAAIGVAIYYWINDNATLTISMLIAAMFLPLMDPLITYSAYYNGKKNFKKMSLVNSAERVSSAIAILIALLLTDNVLILLFVYFAASTATRSIIFAVTRKEIVQETKQSDDVVTETISYGRHLSFMNALGTVATHIDKVLIFHFLGAAEVAAYVIALAIPDRIRAAIKSLAAVALPRFSERSLHTLQASMAHRIFSLGLFASLVAAVYILFAPILYSLLFPAYVDVTNMSQIAALAIIAVVGIIPGTILKSQKATKVLYMQTIVASILKILLTLILIPLYGIPGAVIAYLVHRFSLLAISTVSAYKIRPIDSE